MKKTHYDVDILVQHPVTIRILAENETEARESAMAGRGEDVSGVDYQDAEIIDVQQVMACGCGVGKHGRSLTEIANHHPGNPWPIRDLLLDSDA